MTQSDDLLTTSETAALLDCDPSTVSRKVKAGLLVPAKKLPGLRGPMLFSRADVALLAPEPEERVS